MKNQKIALVDSVLLLIAIIWAVNFSVIKVALEEIPPLAFNTLRFIGSSIVLSLYYHFFIGDYGFIKKHFKKLVLLSLVGNTVLQLLFIEGINLTSASNASLMYSTVPMFVAILSTGYRVEKVKGITWLGIILSFLGIIMILSNSGSGIGFSSSTISGDVMILLTAVCWSAFTVFAKPLIEETSMLRVVSVTFVIGTFFLIPFSVKDFATMDWSIISLNSWMLLLFSFLFANVLGYIGWFYAVKIVGNVQTAVFQNFIPVFAVATAAFFLGETVSWKQVLGGLGIVGGVTITRMSMILSKNGKNASP